MKKIIIIMFIIAFAFLTSIMVYGKNADNVVDATGNSTNNDIAQETVIETTETVLESIDVTEPVKSTEPEIPKWVYNENLKQEENIYLYLTEYLGFSSAAACGIVANIAYETGWKFKSDIGNPDYGAYGLIQWMGNRRKQLIKWCNENGKDFRSMEGQMDFMYWELLNADPYGTYEHLIEAKDSEKGAYDAGWYFCYWYERPNRKTKASKWRGSEAKKYYRQFVIENSISNKL